MAKFDWDREAREARKRKHGSIPAWADPGFLEPNVRRKLLDLTERQQSLVAAFDARDDINKVMSVRDMRARLRVMEKAAIAKAGSDDESTALASLVHDWHAAADERVRAAADKAKERLAKEFSR
jgi:hypothetical protein